MNKRRMSMAVVVSLAAGLLIGIGPARLSSASSVPASPPTPTGPVAPTHAYRVWSDGQARQASTLLGTPEARSGKGPDRAAAEAFANRASAALPQVVKELGSRFESAAIDATTGNRLVVRVTGAASSIESTALARLDGESGGEVELVGGQPPSSEFDRQYEQASHLVGQRLGGSHVLQVTRDDMAGRLVVGVDVDASGATAALPTSLNLAVAVVVPALRAADWGTPGRGTTPVAGGENITAGGHTCSSALTATRGGSPVVVTAGHCITASGAGATWKLGYLNAANQLVTTATLGAATATLVQPTDAATIANGSGGSRSCVVMATSCAPVEYSTQYLVQGAPVGKSGATTGDTTGVITSTLVTSVVGTETLTNAIESSACALPGDSGGVLYSVPGDGNVVPLGITDGSSFGSSCGTANGRTVYSNWHIACVQLSIDAANCPTTPPTAVIAETPLVGLQAQAEHFDGSGSYAWGETRGAIASYSWNFGDFSLGSGASPSHTYAAAGSYTVTLTVTDLSGRQGSSSTQIYVAGSGQQAKGDFNGDGKSDVAVLYDYGSSDTGIFVFLSNGSGFLPSQSWYRSGVGNFAYANAKVVAGDFNADGKADIGVLYDYDDSGAGRTSWLVATSTGSSFGGFTHWWDNTAFQWNLAKPLVGDFTGDGKVDVAVLYDYDDTGGGRSSLLVFPSTGTTFGPMAHWWDSLPGAWQWLASKPVAGDFNGDGKADVAVLYDISDAGSGSASWRVARSTGAAFNAPTQWWSSTSFVFGRATALAGDFTGDGKADVGVLYDYDDTGGGSTSLLVNPSTGTSFGTAAHWWDSGPNAWLWRNSMPTTGDFTGDGKTDVAVLYDYFGGNTSLLVNASTGSAFGTFSHWWDSGPGNWEWWRSKVA